MSSPPLPPFKNLLASLESPTPPTFLIHRFFCPTCGKGFVWKSDMVRHARSHENENYMFCKICNVKRFYRVDSLRRHERVCEKKYNVLYK
jgi:uncharacterized Zn-finger protein